jgi:hypothetical protein
LPKKDETVKTKEVKMNKSRKKRLHLNKVEVARLVTRLQEKEQQQIKGGDPGVLMTTCVRVFCVESEG